MCDHHDVMDFIMETESLKKLNNITLTQIKEIIKIPNKELQQFVESKRSKIITITDIESLLKCTDEIQSLNKKYTGTMIKINDILKDRYHVIIKLFKTYYENNNLINSLNIALVKRRNSILGND